jgi:predicted O-linked N-acetylglucosamine transferase (SPINDLY family)
VAQSADDWYRVGMDRLRGGDDAAAADAFQQAAHLQPGHADAWGYLGYCRQQLGQIDAAIVALRDAVRLAPKRPEWWSNLGTALQLAGLPTEGRDAYLQATRLVPIWHPVCDNYLLALHYDPRVTPRELAKEHEAWGKAAPAVPTPAYPNVPDPDRPLRVGFVSPDLRQHPVARFFEPLLAGFNSDCIEAYLYSEYPQPDAVSARLRDYAKAWRDTVGRPADQVAAQVRADRIDVLIDLAGHTAHHRLDVFARRPAPVQASYLGYPYPTGFSAIPYWIADDTLAPAGEPLPGTVVRLPGHFAAFRPPDDAPPIAPPPAELRGHVTFAVCHGPKKLNDDVLALWGRVLRAVPGSRLLCLWSTFNAEFAGSLRARLQAEGVDRAEVRHVPASPAEYLPLLADVDIGLDPFPFSGHTMTCEVLWMGVPVLTRRGDRPSGRLTASALTALGLTDLIAETDDAYVAAAAGLAADAGRRRALREGLRPLMRDRLCNGAVVADQFTAALRGLWKAWCERS